MRVLLIQPPRPSKCMGHEHLFRDEPLALEYLGADVGPFSEVRILDMRVDSDLQSQIAGFQPDIVGVTGYTVHVSTIKSICQQVKRLQPEILTVVGGHHATVSPRDFLSSCIDIIVIGDGVPTLREIIQKLAKREDYRSVRGIAFSQNDEFCVSEPRPLTDLDDFPLPDRSLTRQYRNHYYSEWWKPAASTRTSRGCPHRCNFCAQWKVNRGKYYARCVESVMEELGQMEERYVFLADDESFIDAKRMSRLAEEIKLAGIKKSYSGYIRSDTVIRNPQMLEKWKKIGLDAVVMGMEFYAQEDLDYVNKGTSTDQNRQAVEILQSLDIRLSPALFMVRPDYDEVKFREYARYIRDLDLDLVEFTVLTPLPGTDLYDHVKEQMLEVDFEFYDLVHTVLPTKLPLREFYRNLAQLYTDSNSLKTQLTYSRKYPLRRLPGIAWGNYRFLSRIRNLYKDYST